MQASLLCLVAISGPILSPAWTAAWKDSSFLMAEPWHVSAQSGDSAKLPECSGGLWMEGEDCRTRIWQAQQCGRSLREGACCLHCSSWASAPWGAQMRGYLAQSPMGEGSLQRSHTTQRADSCHHKTQFCARLLQGSSCGGVGVQLREDPWGSQEY